MDYLQLIPSSNNQKPKFAATVALLTGALAEVRETLVHLTTVFNVDAAVGEQLDMIGEWVGFKRRVNVPITGVFFSWNTAGLGWNEGSWKGPFDAGGQLTLLDDDTYRNFLRLRILTNYWQGDAGSIYDWSSGAAASILGAQVALLDNLDMTVSLYVNGTLNAVAAALVEQGFFPPRPMGVTLVP